MTTSLVCAITCFLCHSRSIDSIDPNGAMKNSPHFFRLYSLLMLKPWCMMDNLGIKPRDTICATKNSCLADKVQGLLKRSLPMLWLAGWLAGWPGCCPDSWPLLTLPDTNRDDTFTVPSQQQIRPEGQERKKSIYRPISRLSRDSCQAVPCRLQNKRVIQPHCQGASSSRLLPYKRHDTTEWPPPLCVLPPTIGVAQRTYTTARAHVYYSIIALLCLPEAATYDNRPAEISCCLASHIILLVKFAPISKGRGTGRTSETSARRRCSFGFTLTTDTIKRATAK